MISLFVELKYKRLLKEASDNQLRSTIGTYGEFKTARFIQKRGFKLLKKNWRHKHGEIDLIARDKACLVFIEVRTRSNNALVTGKDTISLNKQHTLKKTAHAYMSKLKKKPKYWRFDVAEVEFNRSTCKTKIHYRESILF